MKIKFYFLVLITILSIAAMVFVPKGLEIREYGVNYILCLVILVSIWIGAGAIDYFGTKSITGKSLLYICLGMFSWNLGCLLELIYSDYPSWADIGYVLTIPFGAYGLFLLLKNIDFNYNIRTFLKITILPLAVLIPTFILSIYGSFGGDLTLSAKIFNIIYPMGDVIFLSLALIILSLTYGGIMFKPFAIICLGFALEATADFLYSYGMATESYYSGNITDIFFALAFFTIGASMYYLWYINQTTAETVTV